MDSGAPGGTLVDSDLPECTSTRTYVDPREQVSDPGRAPPCGTPLPEHLGRSK
jgi:hypothetical protein